MFFPVYEVPAIRVNSPNRRIHLPVCILATWNVHATLILITVVRFHATYCSKEDVV